MSEQLRDFFVHGFEKYLNSLPEDIASDSYAVSILVSDESDIGLQAVVVAIGVHTESQVERRLRKASGSEWEARWNFMVWNDPYEPFEWNKNNYQIVMGEERNSGPIGYDLLEEWLREKRLWNLDENNFDSFDDFLEAVEKGEENFRKNVVEAVLELRRNGVVSLVFGKEILVAIHGIPTVLNNEATRTANPGLDPEVVCA